MSAFEALRIVRLRSIEHPNMSFREVTQIVIQVEADGTAHDFEAAEIISELVPTDIPSNDDVEFYRHCIRAVITAHRPIWIRTIPHGRKRFADSISQDERQCFASAGLLENVPSSRVIEWWDQVSGESRMLSDGIKMAQARVAERLSLHHETRRLANLGIDLEPVWTALDDNHAGYDILSYDLGTSGPISRVLEVKSTIASPLRFYVTHNEWNECLKRGAAYHFHIWDMRTETLYERSATEIEPHIPVNRGVGRWWVTEIRLGGDTP
jgi:hypothetical protein